MIHPFYNMQFRYHSVKFNVLKSICAYAKMEKVKQKAVDSLVV